MHAQRVDLLLVNPGGRETVYQKLGDDLTAVEPPLWVRLIAGFALDRGFTVRIIDSEAECWGPARVAEEIRQIDPVLVGMVVFGHQPSASTQMMVPAGETCRAIKKLSPATPIIIVGGHVSALPERTLREEAVDFVCNGEGPITICQLIEAIRTGGGEALPRVEGLVWIDRGLVRHNPPATLIKDVGRELHGNVWHLLPMHRYRAHNWHCFDDLSRRSPYASIYTSLGCPYKCTFCCINAPFGSNRYRMRNPQDVVAEVDHLYGTYGVRTIKIIDEMFVLNDRHVTAIAEGLAALPFASELNIWAYARVDTIRPERLALLRSAGIRWLALGIESASEHVRDGAEKSLDQTDIIEIVQAIKNAGIHVIGNYIFGLPDDDHESMGRTLEMAKELNCEFANFYSAMAYPGSKLYSLAVENGWLLPRRWSGFSQHSIDCTPLPTEKVSAVDVLRFRDSAFHDYFSSPAYLDLVESKFGQDVRDHVVEMARYRLRRELLGEVEAARG